MPEVAARDSGVWKLVTKRWRAWLRAVHRDFGYLAIGFTVIYAVSGIAQNHIEDWGDVSYQTSEKTIHIAAIGDDVADDVAIRRVTDAVALGTPSGVFRAGDEIRLDYASGAKVTAIGTDITIQTRERRAFIGVANWLHKARGKKAWKYVSDVYAILLLYLATSGIFMIKGRLGLKWRGAALITAGVAVPIVYVLVAGGPGTQHTQDPDVPTVAPAPAKIEVPGRGPGGVLKPLPPGD